MTQITDRQKDVWTLSTGAKKGDILQLCFHRVEVLEVVEKLPHYSRCRVKVHGPVPGSAGIDPRTRLPWVIPPLLWGDGLYDPTIRANVAEVREAWIGMIQTRA